MRATGATGEVELLVGAEADGFEIRETIQTLLLPPEGSSTRDAYFQIRPLTEGSGREAIRFRLYYEMNLLESIVFEARIAARFDDFRSPEESAPNSFRQEPLEQRCEALESVVPRALHVDIRRQGGGYDIHFAVDEGPRIAG